MKYIDWSMIVPEGIPEKQYLGNLYAKNRSVLKMEKILGVSCPMIIDKLRSLDIEINSPGGRNNVGTKPDSYKARLLKYAKENDTSNMTLEEILLALRVAITSSRKSHTRKILKDAGHNFLRQRID